MTAAASPSRRLGASQPQALTRQVLTRIVAAAVALLVVGSVKAERLTPEIANWTGPGSAPVYFIAARQLPIVDIRLVFDAGSARDGDTPGAAQLVTRALDQGTEQTDADTIARRLEDAGARLSTSVHRDRAEIHLRSLSEPQALEEGVATLEEILAGPAFRDSDVDRIRGQMEQDLRAERQSASAMAQRALYQAMYGNHPYASPPSGTQEGLAALDPERARAFYERHYVAANAGAAIVGDLEQEDAEAIVERLLGALETGEPAPDLPAAPEEPAEREIRLQIPSSQTALVMGLPAVARGEEATEYPLRVVNQAFGGGGLVSRLHQAMREDRGLSYSTSSRLNVLPARGPWLIQSTVRADRAEEALEVLQDEVQRLVDEGLPDEEIEAAIRHLTGAFPLSLASNNALSAQLAVLVAHGLPTDHLDQYIPRMEAVDGPAIREALADRLRPERMVTVIAGPDVDEPDHEVEAE